MTLLESTTLAQSQALQNLSANLEALKRTQPQLVQWVAEQSISVEWVFGRDETHTALDDSGQWWSGCSMPRRAAEAVFARLEVKGCVGCFLAPPHSAAILTALGKLRPEQAIIVVVPEMRDLALVLRCEDFAQDISSHRIWFAAGPAWDVALRDLFDRHDGLATPTSFIRTPDADPELIDPIISAAQRLFSDVNGARTSKIQSIRQEHRGSDTSRVCVVAPARFRLWSDFAPAMLGAFDGLAGVKTIHFDADDPCNSSPLALIKAATECGVIFTANTARTDLPGLVPETIPWLTWVTTPRIPSAALATEHNRLIVVDPILREAAIRSGWAKSQIYLGSWPGISCPLKSTPQCNHASASIGIIADTVSLETPKDLVEYSSHSLLWEAIRHDFQQSPFIFKNINEYLSNRMRQHGVGEEGFPRARFLEKLILPAYQQALARTLIAAKTSLALFGAGWEMLDEFKPHARGGIQSREQLVDAVASISAVLDVWPTPLPRPIESIGIPVVRATTGTARDLVDQVTRALQGMAMPSPVCPDRLDRVLMERILQSLAA